MIVVLVAACGRLGFDSELGTDGSGSAGDAVDASAPVCGVARRIGSIGTSDVRLALADTPGGAVISWVPVSGGAVTAVAVDPSWNTVASPVEVSSDATYMNVSAVWTDRLLLGHQSSNFLIRSVATNLASYDTESTLSGLMLQPAFVTTQGQWFSAYPEGTLIHTLHLATDGSYTGFNMQDTLAPAGTEPTRGSVAAQGNELHIVWRTAPPQCWLTRYDVVNRTFLTSPNALGPCDAITNSTLPDGGFSFARLDNTTVTLSTGPVIPNAKVPRMIDDTQNLWITWLAADTGDLRAAYRAGGADLVSLPISGLGSGAFDGPAVAIIDGRAEAVVAGAGELFHVPLCVP
ncbi:MAG: hypothetical protein ACKV2T_15365 [Kofleriaceae bacterium]